MLWGDVIASSRRMCLLCFEMIVVEAFVWVHIFLIEGDLEAQRSFAISHVSRVRSSK